MVTVEVGSQVTGQVLSLHADFNSVVREGQVLARLDPRNVETQLRNVQANRTSARSRIRTAEADLENAHTSVETARANLAQAEADLELSEVNLRRARALFEEGAAAETEVENATTNHRSAEVRVLQQRASLQTAESQIGAREAAIEQAYASLEQAEADLQEAELNVEYTVIRSPVDGVVISREVDVGQTVSASTSAPTLYLIANDLAQMQVQAAIDEADIGLLGQDNEVTFTVDAYPNDQFRGRIGEIRTNPSTSQNVVTYPVIITFDNPDLKLKPGMTANISILVDRRENVLSVPNTALRYNPPNAEALLTSQDAGSGAGAETAEVTLPAGEGRGFNPANRSNRDDTAPEGPATIVDQTRSSTYMAGQEWGDTEKVQFQPVPPAPPGSGRVWVMSAMGVPQPRDLMVGLTDGSRTEVVSGDIREGELVLIGDSSNLSQDSDSSAGSSDPRNMMRMLSGGGGGRRGGW
jgi:HlyD family secretion protein